MNDRGFGEKDQRWKSSKSPILWMVRCQLHRWHCVIGNTGLWVESREAGNQRGKRTLCLELVKVCMFVGHQTRDVWWYLETWVRSLGDSLGLEIKTWPSSSWIYPVEIGGHRAAGIPHSGETEQGRVSQGLAWAYGPQNFLILVSVGTKLFSLSFYIFHQPLSPSSPANLQFHWLFCHSHQPWTSPLFATPQPPLSSLSKPPFSSLIQ